MLPVVLHHGLLGGRIALGPVVLSSFHGIERSLARAGYAVCVSGVHPTAGIETRAKQLRKWVLEHRNLHQQKIVLVAHSLGGLDARYMLARLDMAEHIDTLVTIATPHRGSPFADWCVENVGRRWRMLKLMELLGLDVQAFLDVTTERCARFNEEILDVPGVKYVSISGRQVKGKMPFFALQPWRIVNETDGENDGLVSVKSAVWAEHLETWDADHWHQINARYGLNSWKSGDISPKYLQLLRDLNGAGGRRAAVGL